MRTKSILPNKYAHWFVLYVQSLPWARFISRIIFILQAFVILPVGWIVISIPPDGIYYHNIAVWKLVLLSIPVACGSVWYLYYFFLKDLYRPGFINNFFGFLFFVTAWVSVSLFLFALCEWCFGYDLNPAWTLLFFFGPAIPVCTALVFSIHELPDS